MVILFYSELLDKYESTKTIMPPLSTGKRKFVSNNPKPINFLFSKKSKISLNWDFVRFVDGDLGNCGKLSANLLGDSYFPQSKLNPCQI